MLKPSRRQRINRCRREGMRVSELGPDAYRQAYDVIVQNRQAKGFPVTMSFGSIEQMMEVFPGKLRFFGVFQGDLMIAASICVNVNPSVLYVFYWGDLPGYERFSPVTLLAEWIYDHAHRNGFQHIDFGTSTKDGVPIYGLMNFKKEIGCYPSLKPSYIKTLKS
jgi:lipid II:glycine glycyltransferase (peptidoglycan interpeptide bridge formation enzyme)